MSPDASPKSVALPDLLPREPRERDADSVDRNTALGEISIHRPGRYILELSPTDRRMPFLRLTVRRRRQSAKVLYVPVTRQTSYLLRSIEGGVVLQFDSSDIIASRIRPMRIGDFARLLRQRRREKRFELPFGKGIVLRPLLYTAGVEEHELALSLKSLAGWGFGVASDNLQKTLSRRFDCLPAPAPERPTTADPKIAVALHLHYVDLWPEFEALLGAIGRPFHLIVTLTEPNDGLAERVRARFRSAEVLVYDNRGRDVGAFMQLLRDGRLEPFDLICKLHGKKSALSGPRMMLGEIWRQASAFDLIGSSRVVDRVIAAFERSKNVQMIGSRRFRLPNQWKGEEAAWGENRPTILSMLETMGMEPDTALDFFAGTMFWVRRDALEPLKQLDLSLASFPNEPSQQDGTLQHALERIFGMICRDIAGVAWDDE